MPDQVADYIAKVKEAYPVLGLGGVRSFEVQRILHLIEDAFQAGQVSRA